jgi:lysophospholipase L1-like esterase
LSTLTEDERARFTASGAIVPARFVDTAANLARQNPVVGAGLVAYATDTGEIKIGDGVNAYSSLVGLSSTYAVGPGQSPFLPGPSSLTRRYDPATCLYGMTGANFKHARGKLGLAASGQGLCRVVAVGDSLTEGYQATTSTQSYPVALRSIMATAGYPAGGTGVVQLQNNTTADARWGTIPGAWTVFQGKTTQTNFLQCVTNASTITFTSDLAGTVAEVWYLGTSAAFDVSIDGGAASTVTPSGASATLSYVVTGLANATHTIAITTKGTAATFIVGAQVRSTSGLSISNAGINSTKASDWNLTVSYYTQGPVTASYGCDLAIIELGSNDVLAGISEATFKTNMAAVIAQYKTATCDVLLLHPTPANNINWADTTKINSRTFYQIADTAGVPLLDLNDRWQDYTTQFGTGLMNADGIHCTAGGYYDVAIAVARVLAGC